MTLRRTTCAHCRAKFVADRPSQIVHVDCAPGWAIAQADKRQRAAAKEAKVAAKVERAQTRARRRALETKPQLLKAAQLAFNGFIRARDRLAGHGCISSGRRLDWAGNAVDAGHYRSVGSAPHLRFHEDNCHAQSKHDNQFRAGNAVDYRLGLIARIGLERVEALECASGLAKWTHDELREIRATYKRKEKELSAQAGRAPAAINFAVNQEP